MSPRAHKTDEPETNLPEEILSGSPGPSGEVKAKKTRTMGKEKGLLNVTIPPINVSFLELVCKGDTGIIVHKWTEKAIKEMLDKMMGKAHKKREVKDPEQEFRGSLYILPDGKYGFPGIAFKLAMVEACRYVDGISMAAALGAFHVCDEYVHIESDEEPFKRMDPVRVGGKGPGTGTADIRFRPEFKNWKATITLRYNASFIKPEQLANLLNIAGFSIGVGDWRPVKRGMHGTFHVETAEE